METLNDKYLWNSDLLETITEGTSSRYWECKRIEIDSRKVKKGDLFLALKGKNFDGHDFILDSMRSGASAAMVKTDFKIQNKKSYNIVVKDVLKSLFLIAKESRKRAEKLYNTRFIAITGSSGKTSTKEMMKAAFSAIGKTYASPGSYNNHIGVPYSLANIYKNSDFGVFEIGMNKLNEVKNLSLLVNPHLALITNIAEAHIGNFHSLEDIMIAKTEIFQGLRADGYAIINRDLTFYEKIKSIASKAGIRNLVTFGINKKSDVYLKSRRLIKEGQILVVNAFGKDYEYKIRFNGLHQVLNSLSVLAALIAFECDPDKGLKALYSVPVPSGRGIKHYIYIKNQESVVIDDSYNANPSSMEASIKALKEMSGKNRSIIIIGDMKELGKFSKALHERMADFIIRFKIDLVFCVGAESRAVHKKLNYKTKSYWFKNVSDLQTIDFINILLPGDYILIKGSRIMEMEKLVKYLIKNCVKR